ncbi:unnamed protein product [Calicophoron daubneyi]|uniref:Dynein light chain n=1 Tax=Calicophoron daubneyi TaxID=300641 RepID=A0AAV2TWB2_CALDB
MDERTVPAQKSGMPKEMQETAFKIASDALKHYQLDKDIASYVKKEFEKKYPSNWNCVVGRSFGSCVMYEEENFVFFYLQGRGFLLYKS